MGYVRRWDRRATDRVHVFIANSRETRTRLQRYYGRPAHVVYPPIDTTFFVPQEEQGDYFLVVSRLVSYKRVDVAIQAFARLGLPLKVVGAGRAMRKLAKIAGPTVELLGWQSRERLRDLYAGCRGLVLPGKEDLGMTALEAQSAGRPVIAYGEGGALETVIPRETGLHFVPQTVDALINAVQVFQGMSWDKERIRRNALQYKRSIFLREMDQIVRQTWAQHGGDAHQLARPLVLEAET
jgi:glycosyltransferase involved in cell wall biosynthesis